ncbi:coth protein-domain-containing protein [Helicostylum pulchrum]|nr:coth protein-domain-containing protein [Helicostylum pulchrum]
MTRIKSHISLLFVIGSVISTAVATSITYSVVGLPSSEDNEFGVLVDGTVYKLAPSEEDATILFKAEAPVAETNYHFVELRKDTDEIVHREEFDREPIVRQINQVYGRSWTTQSVKKFERIYDAFGFRHESDLHPEDEIPSIHIVADQGEIDRIHDHYNQKKMKVKADVTIIGAHQVQKISGVKFNIAGRGSRFEPKPSYNIELHGEERLGGFKTLKLKAAATDPSFLREKMTSEMLIAAGLPIGRVSYKRVYLNNVAMGLYVFAEKYDRTWLDQNANPGTPAEYKNGVLYQGTGSTRFPGEFSDLRYISDEPSVYADHGYKIALEDRTEKKGFTVLADFIKFVDDELKKPISNSTENEKELVETWGKMVGAEVFLRNIIFDFLTTGWDNYLFWGDNYYMYKCPILHYFVYVSSDLELTFGNSPLPRTVQLEGDYRHVEGFQNRPLPKALLRVPFFRNYFENALKNITTNIFDPRVSFPVVDSLTEILREDVKWDQGLARINADKDFSNPPKRDLNGGKLVGEGPLNRPKDTDPALSKEHSKISRDIIDFQSSVDGPTGYESLLGIKEFIQGKFDNVKAHL